MINPQGMYKKKRVMILYRDPSSIGNISDNFEYIKGTYRITFIQKLYDDFKITDLHDIDVLVLDDYLFVGERISQKISYGLPYIQKKPILITLDPTFGFNNITTISPTTDILAVLRPDLRVLAKPFTTDDMLTGILQVINKTVGLGSELFVFPNIDMELIKYLSQHDSELFSIPPRFFEELLSELLHQQGWEVQLSPIGADGGIDIIAIQKETDYSEMMLVQAKRYAENRRVGVSVVRELLHVVDDKRATRGMVVTTSSFTKPAIEEQHAYQWILSLKDHDQIVKWLKEYQNTQKGQMS